MSAAASAAPQLGSRRRWVILIVLAGAQMLVQLDATIINTALPAIKRAFELTEAQSLWVADAYFVTFGGLLLLAGALGDRFGRRRIMVIGMFLFAAASIAVAFSPDANWLIVGRGVQGLGGALVVPQTLSILTAVFPREERTRALGIWAAAMGFGMAFGPFAGGILIDNIGWQGVFWVPAPIAVLAIIGCVALPESRSLMHTRLDVPGAVTGTIGMVAIVFAIIEGIQRGWGDPMIIGSFIVAAVAWTSFVIIERRTEQPLLPLAFFRQRDFTGSMVGMFFIMFALMGVMFYLPQFFQLAQGVSATTSGLRMMPLALAMMIGAPIAAKILPKVGPRLMLFWAPAVHGGGALILLSFITIDTPYWMIAPVLVFLGMGGAMHMPATTDTAMAAVPVDLAGKASAVNNAGRQLGGTLAIAILGSFAAAVYASGTRDGLAGLPIDAATVDTMAGGIGAAFQLLPTLDQGIQQATHAALTSSFVDAITQTMRFGVIFAVISGVAGWVLVPRRQRTVQVTSLSDPRVGEVVAPVAPVAPVVPVELVAVSTNGADAAGTNGAGLTAPIALVRPQKSGDEFPFD